MNGVRLVKGNTRLVLLFDSYAIKVPRPGNEADGREANRREAALWKAHQDERLCPVLFADEKGAILVMRRAQKYYAYNKKDFIDQVYWRKVFTDFLAFANDMHPGNFGYLDGRLVLLDYGTMLVEG
jgi:hypothetical protein